MGRQIGGICMSKKYIWSKRNDRTSLDTNATSMIRDILILLGIYDSFQNSHIYTNDLSFMEHYLETINKPPISPKSSFAGEYHYYNRGAKVLRDISNQKTIKTSKKHIKKLCMTHRTKNICIPINTAAILNVLFEYVDNNNELKHMFIQEILIKCVQYTLNIDNYPYDCSSSILGFIDVFLNNMNDFNYSDRSIEAANDIKKTMANIIERYKIQEQCILRNS